MTQDSYLKRVRLMMIGVLTIWRTAGPKSLHELALKFILFVIELVGFFAVIVAPLTFWLAPFYLWLHEREQRLALKRKAELDYWLSRADEIADFAKKAKGDK